MSSSKQTGTELTNRTTINHWMIKSKGVGTTAEDLWEAAKEYFMWVEANPITKQEMIKQTGAMVTVELPRVFNIDALCVHLGVSEGYLQDCAMRKETGDFHMVAQRIFHIIRAQKYEYAAVGIFNANMVGKDLGFGDVDNKPRVPAVINITVDESGPPLLTNEGDVNL